ncbi:unnamed protein product [Adineta steineri]|uniref:F-box domain-containing protein n=3 Tax=Adineta steineri TaxID=433720 RepID=A0A813SEU4_9BILA|nr:unnamed protein product [Adineta steineri]CAF1331493.1 unnamed protein product [Adineta steineri]
MSVVILFENLSNELIIEIFEYFNGYEICKSFSNLNSHFQQLINSSFVLFKFYSNDFITDNQLLLNHKHQLISLQYDASFSSYSIDSSFNHLESLIINNISSIKLLSNLSSLPRLYSLTIDTQSRFDDLTQLYQLVFTLPKLKYFKCISEIRTLCYLSSKINDKQLSNLEYLYCDHTCTINELSTIIPYLPKLRSLSFYPITLNNLKLLINENLEVLSLDFAYEDIEYFDAYLWESFILKYLPKLEKTYFTFDTYYGNGYESPILYNGMPNKFNSSFWIQRKWILEIKIIFDSIYYLINPYKKRWYENENDYSKLVHLIIEDDDPVKPFTINQYLNHILNLTQIFHLEIHEIISLNKLSQILLLLPDLQTLHLDSISFLNLEDISDEEFVHFIALIKKNQIKKLFLEKRIGIDAFELLFTIFPHLNYLQINCRDYQYTQFLLKYLLKHQNNKLIRLFCFSIPFADDKMMNKLKNLIIQNSTSNFTIQRVSDHIYVNIIENN